MPALQRLPGRTSQCPLVLLIIATALSLACANSPQQVAQNSSGATSSPPGTPQLTETSQTKTPNGPTLPPLSDVQNAVKRVCFDAVTIDTNQSTPFIVGDFNGDGSEDLAVIVRPAKHGLPKLNSEYANWITEEPQRVVLPDPSKSVQRLPQAPPRTFIQANDSLLLVLHGYEQAGWQHQYARQTYLLRNAIGENIRAQSFAEALKAGDSKSPPQQHPGDVIAERLNNHDGFLYWTNGRYAWWK